MRVTSLNQLMVVLGILAAYLVNAALASTEEWRVMLGLAVVPSVALFAGMLRMPETPRWLVARGREDEARAVLQASRDEDEVDAELREITEVDEQEGDGGLSDLLAGWCARRCWWRSGWPCSSS